MSRRKTSEENIRKLTRMGNRSLGVTLPIELVNKLRWREGQKVKVISKGRSLILRDWVPPRKKKVEGLPRSP